MTDLVTDAPQKVGELAAQNPTPRRVSAADGKKLYKAELNYPPFGNLARFPQVRWKTDKDGGREAYFVTDEGLKIWELTYLKRAGVRQLKAWASLDPASREVAIFSWLEEALAAKGIKQSN